MVLMLNENTEGVMKVLDWLKKCVDGGVYDDLSGMSFRADHTISVMQQAAAEMGIDTLAEITAYALGRIEDGEQLDATQTVGREYYM